MQPGRELDALVAEKVMGCKVTKILDYGVQGDYRYRCDCPGPHSIEERPHATVSFDADIKDYSTDIACAWEVVEKAGILALYRIPTGWRAVIGRGEWSVDGDTAPHAICLAALKAVGVEIP